LHIARLPIGRLLGQLDSVGLDQLGKDLLVAALFPGIQQDCCAHVGICKRIGIGGKVQARPSLGLHRYVPDRQRLQTLQLFRIEFRPGNDGGR